MATRLQRLPARSEFRFELEPGERLSLRLVPDSGDAEVFGAELVPGKERWYAFGDEAKAAVSTWSGCELEMSRASTEYVPDDPSPTYTSYANVHLHLEGARLRARAALRAQPDLIRSQASAALAAPTQPGEGGALPIAANGEAETQLYSAVGQGPRVLVVGPESAGKSSLVKQLANCALRSPAVCSTGLEEEGKEKDAKSAEESEVTGWWPTVVNLDPSAGAPPLPCTMSLLPLSPVPYAALPSCSPAFPFGTTAPTTGATAPGPNAAHGVAPLTLWLGKEDVRANEAHSMRVVEWLGAALEKRLARDPRARMSGIIVDTQGVTSADGRGRYAFVQHCVRTLKIDTIIVLGHEKLNIELSRIFGGPESGIRVIKLPKSGGVVELDTTYKERLRALQIRSYFYGGSAGTSRPEGEGEGSSATLPGHSEPLGGLPALSPLTTSIPFDLLEIYRVGQENMAPSSALPIGMGRTVTETQLVKLDPVNSAGDQAAVLHSVLALIEAPRGGGGPGQADSAIEPPPSDDEITGATVLGFIHIGSIDATRKKMSILSPNPGRKLPSKTALLGTLDWQDA